MSRDTKEFNKIRKKSTSNLNQSNIRFEEKPALTTIQGNHQSKPKDFQVSPKAQENYINNVTKENQIKVSSGSKLDVGIKNQTFERFNLNSSTGLRRQTEAKGLDKDFGLSLPNSLKSSGKVSQSFVDEPQENKLPNQSSNSVPPNVLLTINDDHQPPQKITLKDKKKLRGGSNFDEDLMHSAFIKRVGLGMSAMACLTLFMWWGQHNQDKYAHGVGRPEVAMIQSSSDSNYRIMRENEKVIGGDRVVFVDFLLTPSNLNFSKVIDELDRRISKSKGAYRFRFFSHKNPSTPYFDLFAKAGMNPEIISRFTNVTEHRGLTVVWNSKLSSE